jgi:hypothetical protein
MWKRINNYPDYDINEDGVVRSHKYNKTKVLTPVYVQGYPKVLLYREGKRLQFYVHRLVWETFKGPIPEGMCVLHGEGNDRSNSSLSYLRLGTHQENMKNKISDGSSTKGESNANAVLDTAKVKRIKVLITEGVSLGKIAKQFGVGKSTVFRIKSGRCWAHVS